jgi:hypothetical protein
MNQINRFLSSGGIKITRLKPKPSKPIRLVLHLHAAKPGERPTVISSKPMPTRRRAKPQPTFDERWSQLLDVRKRFKNT